MTPLSFIRKTRIIGTHLADKPRDLRHVPRWLRERKLSTLDSRLPWWPYAMVELVEKVLPAEASVFEFGGGGSSLWLCDHGANLTVVEHNPDWIRILRTTLPSDVRLLEIPSDSTGTVSSSVELGYFDNYVQSISSAEDSSLDLVIVDGRARVDCVVAAKDKVKPGGHLLLDDSDRPRYEAAHKAMADWAESRIVGLKIGSNYPATTSLWTRPATDRP